MARTTDRRAPRPVPAGRLAWLGPWLLAGLSTTPVGGVAAPAFDAAPSATLRQLVDIARRNKAAELAATAARLAGTSAPAGVPMTIRAATDGGTHQGSRRLPQLWSLMAAGGRWRAEVLLDGRLHAVDASSGPDARIGPWRIVGLLPEGLRCEQVAAAGAPPLVLVLPPPGRGGSATRYRFDRFRPPAADAVDPPGQGVAARSGPPHAEDDAVDASPEDDAAVRRAALLPIPAPIPAPTSAPMPAPMPAPLPAVPPPSGASSASAP
ncbi:hypothetical protein PV762_05495 [Mitsuaria sp. CC2]|uniref:hypothetical protein n=1 Tax=Mitsuaria sp. CC2 TaxID=3029186 RepID=UPI003B8D59D8